MKSDVISLKNTTDISTILNEAEAVAAYRKLDDKNALRLRLLAEELISMLPNLLDKYHGNFWIENEDRNFEMHVELYVANPIALNKERILKLSKSGKNIAYSGIMGKIRFVVEMMINTSYCDPAPINAPYYYSSGLAACSAGNYYCEWSLQNYQTAVNSEMDKGSEEWDELEKSIIGNLADDVIVGVFENKVDIIIKKSF